MAYTKQTWVTGDTVTSEKLNHIEDGVANAGGGGVVYTKLTLRDNTYALLKLDTQNSSNPEYYTVAEIKSLIENGCVVFMIYEGYITALRVDEYDVIDISWDSVLFDMLCHMSYSQFNNDGEEVCEFNTTNYTLTPYSDSDDN